MHGVQCSCLAAACRTRYVTFRVACAGLEPAGCRHPACRNCPCAEGGAAPLPRQAAPGCAPQPAPACPVLTLCSSPAARQPVWIKLACSACQPSAECDMLSAGMGSNMIVLEASRLVRGCVHAHWAQRPGGHGGSRRLQQARARAPLTMLWPVVFTTLQGLPPPPGLSMLSHCRRAAAARPTQLQQAAATAAAGAALAAAMEPMQAPGSGKGQSHGRGLPPLSPMWQPSLRTPAPRASTHAGRLACMSSFPVLFDDTASD